MGNGQCWGGFRRTSNRVIRLFPETGAPPTQRGAGLQRRSEIDGQRKRERERIEEGEGEGEGEAKLRLAAATKGLHHGQSCQWGSQPSER